MKTKEDLIIEKIKEYYGEWTKSIETDFSQEEINIIISALESSNDKELLIKKDLLIEKYEELVEHYKAYHDSTISPAVKISDYNKWNEYGNQLESEIALLKDRIIAPTYPHEP